MAWHWRFHKPTLTKWIAGKEFQVLDNATAERMLRAMPDANITSEQASDFVHKVAEGFNAIWPHLDEVAHQRGEELLEAHQRVRRASKIRNVRYRVEPQLPPYVLGFYEYLPKV